MTTYDRAAVHGWPAERGLRHAESQVAAAICEFVPRDQQLYVTQQVCEIVEDECPPPTPDTRFPRYRFFARAMPHRDWERFARGTER
jgi:hypothetical protein